MYDPSTYTRDFTQTAYSFYQVVLYGRLYAYQKGRTNVPENEKVYPSRIPENLVYHAYALALARAYQRMYAFEATGPSRVDPNDFNAVNGEGSPPPPWP